MFRGLSVLLIAAVLAAATSACASNAGQPAQPPSPAASTTASTTPGTAASTAATGSAGIAGQTVAGTCPVDRGDPPCVPKPVQSRLHVIDSAGRPVATVDTDGQGQFRVALPAGSYVLRPVLVGGEPARRPTSLSVVVNAGQYTTVTVRLDTGLR
jgi:hypothetical protein